jgi:hypothetical protein
MAKREKAGISQKEVKSQADNGKGQSIFKEHEVVDREDTGDK